MATNTAGSTARYQYEQQVQYLRFDVTYSDSGISSGVSKTTLPSGAIIIGTDALITTTFNAQTTNVLTVGTNGTTATNIVASGDVDETTAGLTQNIKPTSAALGKISGDALVWTKFTQTGTAATQGAATIIIKYVPGNDQ